MFAVRGVTVAFSAFFLIYLAFSLALPRVWPRIDNFSRRISPRHRANLLLALRLFPFMAAAALTAAVTVPSFLLLEPRAVVEPIGALPLVLAGCGIALAAFGVANAVRALMRTSRLIARWTQGREIGQPRVSVPVLRVELDAPALTAAGILRPRVLLSDAAQSLLNHNELRVALRHEVAHVQSRDNLKKLLFLFLAFPGMKPLEQAWLACTEMAADDDAVASMIEALDLAAALLKLSCVRAHPESRLAWGADPIGSDELMTAFAHSPVSLMNARIERLLRWNEDRPPAGRGQLPRYAIGVALTMSIVAAFVVSYGHLLVQAHTATEWLIR